MREFTPEYLSRTRRGMWTDSRGALADLRLDSRSRVLDVGCGTGEFTAVVRSETPATVVGLDADRSLLTVARDRFGSESAVSADVGASDSDSDDAVSVVGGAAGRLPFPDNAFDLVVCQALLVNLPEPASVLREFARVSSDLIAAVEPVNGEVSVSSTVDAESALEAEARQAFIAGAGTGVGGTQLAGVFETAGVSDPRVRRYHHEKRIEPPYSETDLEGARRKATAAGLADHETELRRALAGEYDDLRRRWRAMGRTVIEQMRDQTYRRVEVVPFDVIVGRV